MNATRNLYPKRLVRDEGEVGGGCLLLRPFSRNTGTAQKLAVAEARGEFQGHVVRRLLFLRVTAAGQAHVKAGGRRGRRDQGIEESDMQHGEESRTSDARYE